MSASIVEIKAQTEVIQTRTYRVPGIAAMCDLLERLKGDGFAGKLVVILTDGGFRHVSTEETAALPVSRTDS